MAQKRFLSTTVADDRQLAQLSAEAEMMYLKAVPHLDRDGMITGDPIQLLTIISPLRFSQMATSIGAVVDAWVNVGLVIRFATPAGVALFFKGFLKNQTLRYDREKPSLYSPPPGYIHTANGLRPATAVPWVDQSSVETPGSYPKNPAECPVLPEFQPLGENAPGTGANGSITANPGYYPKTPAKTAVLPESGLQAAEEAEYAALKQASIGKQQQAEAAAAGSFSDCRLLLVDFGVSEPSLGRVLAKGHSPDHVRGWLVEAITASQRRHNPVRDPVAFAVARLLTGDAPARLISAQEYEPEPEPERPTAQGRVADPAPVSLEPPPPDTPAARLWRTAKSELQLQLTPDIFEMYLHPLSAVGMDDDGCLALRCPNQFVLEWLDVRLRRVVEKTASAIHGGPVTIRLEMHEDASIERRAV